MVVRGAAWEAGLLGVLERHAGVEGSGNERVLQGVRPDRLVDPGPTSDTADDPRCAVTVQTVTILGDEDRAGVPVADGQVDGAGGARREGNADGLAALADDSEGAMLRSMPSVSMSAPIASDTRSPLSASSEIGAWSAAGPEV
jgi:hypothetical protein